MKKRFNTVAQLFHVLLVFACTNVYAQKQASDVEQLKGALLTATDSIKAEIYYQLCEYYLEVDNDSVKKYSDLLFSAASKIGSHVMAADAILNKGLAYTYEGILDSAHYYMQKSLRYSLENDYFEGQVTCYICLSSVLEELGDNQGFMENAQKALELSIAKNDTIAILYCSINVGLANVEIRNFEKAAEIYYEALRMCKQVENYEERSFQNGLGRMYEELGQWDSAAYYYRQTLASEDASLASRGIDFFNLGMVMQNDSKLDSAYYFYRKALTCFEEVDNYMYRAHVYNGLGQLKVLLHEYDDAIILFREGLRLAKELNSPKQTLVLLESLHKTYSEMDNSDMAYTYLMERNALSDSLEIEEQRLEIINQQFVAQIRDMQENNEQLGGEIFHLQQKTFLYLLSLILTLFISCIFICLYFFIRKKHRLLFEKVQHDILLTSNSLPSTPTVTNGSNGTIVKDEIKEQIRDKLFEWISQEKFLKNTSVNEVARELGTNQKYLSIVVRDEFGKKFTDYLNEVRIEYLIAQLQSNSILRNYSIEALSDFLGFNTRSTFYKHFKEKTGLTPSYYVKRLKKAKR